MAFCTLAEVRAIVDSDVTDAEITSLINEVDAIMTLTLDTGSINPLVLQGISRRWTAYNIMLKDPNSRSIGEYSENRGEALKQLWAQVEYWMSIADGGIAVVPARSELQ